MPRALVIGSTGQDGQLMVELLRRSHYEIVAHRRLDLAAGLDDVSIKIGITNTQQDGYWVPILAGGVLIILCAFLFVFVIKFIRNRMKEKDIINNI